MKRLHHALLGCVAAVALSGCTSVASLNSAVDNLDRAGRQAATIAPTAAESAASAVQATFDAAAFVAKAGIAVLTLGTDVFNLF